MKYTKDTLLGELLTDPAAVKVLNRYLPGASYHPMARRLKHLTLGQISRIPGAGVSPQLFDQFIKDLNQ